MREARTKPWTRAEIQLLVDQIPKPITPERYPPDPKVAADRAVVRAAREDGRFLSLNQAEKAILDGRFPVVDNAPKSFRTLGQEFDSSTSSARNAYEKLIRKLRQSKG